MKVKKSDDKNLVIELHKKTFPCDEFDDSPSNEYWIVWNGKTPVGFCILRPLKLDKDSVFLSRAGLLYEARGKGLHRRMITVRLRWAKKNGYTSALTYTARDNAQSFSNLQKAGFRLYWPENLYAGKNFLYWIKTF